MRSPEIYTKNQIEKLGNALIYLCQKIIATGQQVSKTHLLKLVFIIEEISVKKYGVPFFNLRFDVWKLGPVSRDLFVELSEEPELLAEFIRRDVQNKGTFIYPIKQFSEDEFSEVELTLLSEISERFLYCTSTELINVTHRKDSPWYKAATENGILDLLESGKMTTTDIEIKLSDSIENDEEKWKIYNDYRDFISFSKSLKS